jgi:hypothetical protein
LGTALVIISPETCSGNLVAEDERISVQKSKRDPMSFLEPDSVSHVRIKLGHWASPGQKMHIGSDVHRSSPLARSPPRWDADENAALTDIPQNDRRSESDPRNGDHHVTGHQRRTGHHRLTENDRLTGHQRLQDIQRMGNFLCAPDCRFLSMLSLFLSVPVSLSEGGFRTLKCERFPILPMKALRSLAPTSATSPGMPRLQQSKRIGSREERLTARKSSRNWFRDRYSWASSSFKKHKISFPSRRKGSDVIPPVLQPVQVRDLAANAVRDIQNYIADHFKIGSKD